MKLAIQTATVSFRRLCLLAICVFTSMGLAQSVQPLLSQALKPGITLDPPTGAELQAHTYDSKGKALPPAPANFRRLGEAKVGEVADLHTLTLRFAENTTLSGMKTTNDFRIEKGGSCEAGNTYAKDTTCTVLVRFTPQGPGNRLGHLTVSTNSSPTPMGFGLGGYGYSPIISFVPAVINTVPGSFPSSVGLLSGAQNLTIDGADTMWVADTGNSQIRQLDSSGKFENMTSAPTPAPPLGIAVDTFGQAYFDTPSTGKMYEIYDYGPLVQASGSGTTTCPASAPCTLSAEALSAPGEMSMDPYNHLFWVDGHEGAAFSTVQPLPANLIFLYDPFPYQATPSSAMAVDAGDNLYSLWANGGDCEIAQQSLYNAENSNVAFIKVAGGHTCGFAGDGGLAGNAEIGGTIGQIAFDAAGDMYFSDQVNQRVRRIDYNTGVIRTIAGNGTAGYTGDGSGALAAKLNTPTGVGVDSQGIVYIISSAASGQVIREVGPKGMLRFGSQPKGVTSSPLQVTVTNTGNSAMTLTNAVITGVNAPNFAIDTATTNCMLTAGAILYPGQTCYIGIKFTPNAVGTRQAILNLVDNTLSGDNQVILNGTGTLPSPKFTITSPANGATFHSGTAVTFSAKVTSTSSPAPTGTVQFKVDGANFGGPVTLSSGLASTSVTGLTQTNHTFSATYSGDANYAAVGPISVSIVVTAVKIGPFVSLVPTINAAGSCAPPAFIVGVSGPSGPAPTGEVQLLDGARLLASTSLANSKATLSAQGISAGLHSLTARYAGDSFHLAAVSSALVENVPQTKPCAGPVNGGVSSLVF
jgi:hypothetical protein